MSRAQSGGFGSVGSAPSNAARKIASFSAIDNGRRAAPSRVWICEIRVYCRCRQGTLAAGALAVRQLIRSAWLSEGLRDGGDLTTWNIVKAALLLFGASGLLAAI